MSGRGNSATVDAVRHALRERVVKLLANSTDDDERKDLAKLTEWLADDGARPRLSMLELLQSPPFYFFFGLILLIAAFITTYAQLNSSLNFLIAMLGVAVLLYGTGSQAAGTFGASSGGGNGGGGKSEASRLLETYLAKDPSAATDAEVEALKNTVAASTSPGISSAAANIAIAGGAAVLTAFFGYGVIEKSNEIRQVFRDYDQYSLVRVEFCYLDDTNCLGAGGGLTGTQVDPAMVTQALLEKAQLQTGLGRSTFASVVGNGLEFVVFKRDLGDDGQLRLSADINVDGYRYSVDNDYIVLDENRPCLNGRNTQSCRYVPAVSDSFEGDRIPRFVIRAVINEAGNTVLVSNSGSDIQAVKPLDPR